MVSISCPAHVVRLICSYTKAIEVSIKRDAVFFSNRAACEC